MSYGWHDFVGNVGVACIVLAYLGVQLGRVRPDQLAYPVINGVGALLLLISLMVDFNFSSVVIEIIWLAISAFGIARILARRQSDRA